MGKKSVGKSGNIVINAKGVTISNDQIKKKKLVKSFSPKPKMLNNRELQLALIENFASMQKVLTNLTIKFDTLSDNMSRLLQLFEISAKSFMQKEAGIPINNEPEEKDLIKKLDVLLDQNKTVAKGITLIEEKIRHRIYGDLPKNEHTLGEKPKIGFTPRA